MQRNTPGPPQADWQVHHRHRRANRAGPPPRMGTPPRAGPPPTPPRGGAVWVSLAVIAVLLAVAGYLISYLIAAPPSRPVARARSVVHPSASPSPSPTPTAPPPGHSGEYQVAEHSFTFTEQSTTLGTRILPVVVRYPQAGQSAATATAGSFPLIVFAPGYRQCGSVYSDLLSQWASAGYVVAVVDFPETNCHTTTPNESDLIHQPQDVTTVISQLEGLSEQGNGLPVGLINASRVAVAGHSDGGDTVAAMAGQSCCRDPSLRAVIVLAGAEWPYFTGTWFAAPTPPMLFVQGTADSWNPLSTSQKLYLQDTTGIRYYLELPGANHFTPYEGNQPPEPIVAQVTIDFLDQYLEGSGDESAAMESAGNVTNVAQLTTDGALP